MILNFSLMGQEKWEESIPQDILDCLVKAGTDTASILNTYEGKYLNFCFRKEKGTFDFCGKRMAFFKGNTGTTKSTKKDFFESEKLYIRQKNLIPPPSGQLIFFNENEVKATGYDVVFITYNKKVITKKEIIKRLKTIIE